MAGNRDERGSDNLRDHIIKRVMDLVNAEPLIRKAIPDTHTLDDIWAGVQSGIFRPVVSEDRKAAAILEILTYPQKRVLHIFLGGGDKESLIGMVPEFQQIARDLGCSEITESGRIGWERELKKHGWKKYTTTMVLSDV